MANYWASEEDFLADLDYISCFPTNSTEIDRKPIKVVSKENNIRMWYDDDDSESEEDRYQEVCGRGRGSNGYNDHLQTMNEIRRDVRSAVGNCFHNDAIEKYYSMMREEKNGTFNDSGESIPESQVNHPKPNETRSTIPVKTEPSAPPLSSLLGKSRKSKKKGKNEGGIGPVDIQSEEEFPALNKSNSPSSKVKK